MVPLKASGQNPSVPLQVQVDHFNLCLRGHVAFSLCLCVFSSDSPKGLTETLAIGFKAHSNTPELSHLRILNSHLQTLSQIRLCSQVLGQSRHMGVWTYLFGVASPNITAGERKEQSQSWHLFT